MQSKQAPFGAFLQGTQSGGGAEGRRTLPSSHVPTMLAKRRVHRLSCAESATGDRFAMTSALPSPDRHGWSRKVSFELRYGTCGDRFDSATNTSVSADSDLLMAWVSLSRSPVACDLPSRSEPARSTRCSVPLSVWVWPHDARVPVMRSEKTVWLPAWP